MTVTFTGTGRGKAGPEEQSREDPEVDTEEDLPLVLEDAVQQPKEGKQGASKSKGKKPAQAQKEQRHLLRITSTKQIGNKYSSVSGTKQAGS